MNLHISSISVILQNFAEAKIFQLTVHTSASAVNSLFSDSIQEGKSRAGILQVNMLTVNMYTQCTCVLAFMSI